MRKNVFKHFRVQLNIPIDSFESKQNIRFLERFQFFTELSIHNPVLCSLQWNLHFVVVADDAGV